MSDAAWYYARGGERYGPLSDEQLRQMARGGSLRPGDYVWREGMADWELAGQAPELLSEWGRHGAPPVVGGAGPYGHEPLVIEAEPVGEFAGFAGFWKRFAAWFIDQLVLGVGVVAILTVVLMFVLAATGREDLLDDLEDDDRFGALVWAVGLLASWLYHGLMESSRLRATLGKMALGIQVTSMEGRGIGFGRATGRHFAKIPSALILWIGFLMAALPPRKQALHDMIAGCLVVNRPR